MQSTKRGLLGKVCHVNAAAKMEALFIRAAIIRELLRKKTKTEGRTCS